MTDIRKSLESLATALETAQAEKPKLQIPDRGLSGNKIHGGRITEFSSTGIKDSASEAILTVKNDGIHVDVIHVKHVANSLLVAGDLTVEGEMTVKKLHVAELSADIRHERSDPLSFTAKGNKTAYGKGMLFPGGEGTKQFLLMERPDRFFSSESLELRANKIYMINGQNVLSQDTLGKTVVKSSLRQLGTLDSLDVSGSVVIDNYVYYDPNTQRIGVGTDSPNGMLSVMGWDHEFIVDTRENGTFKIGTYTTGSLEIVTDDTARITIDSTGQVNLNNKVVIKDKLGVGVKNFAVDADITSAGPIRFQNKKFEVGEGAPTAGVYAKGDIVWNTDPKPSSYIGWVCTTSGTPGVWKPFGQISS